MGIKIHVFGFYLRCIRAYSYLWQFGKGLLGAKVLALLCFFFLFSTSVNAEINTELKTVSNQDTSTIKEVYYDTLDDCYNVFFNLLKYVQSVSHAGSVYTYVLGPGFDFPGGSVIINLATYELLLKIDDNTTGTDGYRRNYHYTYHCQAKKSPALSLFNNDLMTLLNKNSTITPVSTWPRAVDFAVDGGWIYYEKNPLVRYIYKGSDIDSMENCLYFESSRGESIDGWNGDNGKNNTNIRNPYTKIRQSANVDVNELSPLFLNDVKDPSTITPSIGLQPNPADNILKMKWYDMSLFGSYKLMVTDMQGKAVYQKDIIISNKEGNFEVPVTNLRPGSYLLNLANDKVNFQQSFIIVR